MGSGGDRIKGDNFDREEREARARQVQWKRRLDLLTYNQALSRINHIQREQEKTFWDSQYSKKLRVRHLLNIFKSVVRFLKMKRKIEFGFQTQLPQIPKFKIVPLQSPLSHKFLECVKHNNIPMVIDLLRNQPELVYEFDMVTDSKFDSLLVSHPAFYFISILKKRPT